MSDQVTEVTSQGWFSRIMESIKGVLAGLLFFALSFPVLFWNEGRAVTTARSLEEGAGAVVSVASDRVDAGNDQKLVHLSATATPDGPVRDAELGVEAPVLKLERTVEMYQWKEKKETREEKKMGGSTQTVTTYTYEKGWSEEVEDSTDFKEPTGHGNPGEIPFESRSFVVASAHIGAFTLDQGQVGQLDRTEPLPLDEGALGGLPAEVKGRARLAAGGFYLGADPTQPAVGDVKIGYQVVKPGPVSIVARQLAGGRFEPYQTLAGDALFILRDGTHSADSLFKAAQEANTMITWILRFFGWFMMFIGLAMIFKPLVVVADVVPLFGNLLGVGTALFAGLISASLSLLTIAVAWIFYRPLLGIALLVLGGAAMFGLFSLARARKAAR